MLVAPPVANVEGLSFPLATGVRALSHCRLNPSSRAARSFVRAATFAAVVAIAFSAWAQPPRSLRDAAITLGEEGLELLDRGEYAAALEKFKAANKLVPAPTFGVRAALCLEYLERLVEALKMYDQVANMTVDPSWPAIHREAQAEARRRATELRKRVARVYVVLQGKDPERALVEIDGRDYPYDALADGVLLNPGVHTITIAHDAGMQHRQVRVAEGEQHRATFRLDTAEPERDEGPSVQRTLGLVGIGIGAAGVAVGATTGLIAWGKKSDLEDRCPNRVCPPESWSANDSYYAWRNASTAGFLVGGVSLGIGAVLLMTSDEPSREVGTARVEPWVGAGTAGVRGAF